MSYKLLTLLITLIGTFAVAPKSSAGIFLTGRNYPSGGQPVAAVVQDFNNDGVSDIASANYANVSIFLNEGGTFAPANTFSVGEAAIRIASADLNGDGKADLVVTDDINSAYIVLANGDGTFAPASAIRLDDGPLGIAIADLNGDSILDLAIAIYGPYNQNQGELAVLIGLGDGTFGAAVFYSLAHDADGVALVTTDLNHDGKLDLAVALSHFAGTKNGLAVLLGNEDGTFQAAVLSVPGGASDVAAADFNGDGNVDLALASDGVKIVLGNGDGTFQSATTYSVAGPATVAIADLNRDGAADLIVGGDHVVTLPGNGDGTFGSPLTYGVGRYFAKIGYFNADQDPHVVAATAAGGNFNAIVIATGKGDGTLRAPDLNGDGKPEALVEAGIDKDFTVLLNTSSSRR